MMKGDFLLKTFSLDENLNPVSGQIENDVWVGGDLSSFSWQAQSEWGEALRYDCDKGLNRTKNRDYRLIQELIKLVLAPINKESSIGPFL